MRGPWRILEIDPRGVILGFVPIPNGDTATTNFAFGGPDNQYLYFEEANSGTFWRFKLVRLRTTQAISAIMSLASDPLPTDPEALRQFAALSICA
jgi:hypothetical protein